jgi:hypothetical protein
MNDDAQIALHVACEPAVSRTSFWSSFGNMAVVVR